MKSTLSVHINFLYIYDIWKLTCFHVIINRLRLIFWVAIHHLQLLDVFFCFPLKNFSSIVVVVDLLRVLSEKKITFRTSSFLGLVSVWTSLILQDFLMYCSKIMSWKVELQIFFSRYEIILKKSSDNFWNSNRYNIKINLCKGNSNFFFFRIRHHISNVMKFFGQSSDWPYVSLAISP